MQNLIQQSTPEYLIFQSVNEMGAIFVYENERYRWLKFSDASIQGVMDKTHPEHAFSPIIKSMLLFLTLKREQLQVLNLGLGSANIERTLHFYASEIKPSALQGITSVELNSGIIEIAKRYFNLPATSLVANQSAEHFLQQSETIYNAIIIDIFNDQHHHKCILNESFWQQLVRCCNTTTLVSANFTFSHDSQLHAMLLTIKQHFSFIKIIEFHNYQNLVLLFSQSPLDAISKETLDQVDPFELVTCNLVETIKHIHTLSTNN